MRLDYTIWMYILIIVVILLVLVKTGSSFVHALMFALVIGLLFLLITKPPNDIDTDVDDMSCVAIYFAIIFLSTVSILIYSGIMSWEHLDPNKYKRNK